MLWMIAEDGVPRNPEGYDGSVWEWTVLADHDADKRQSILVRISGTAMAAAANALPIRVVVARDTCGRSEIEQVLEWPEPPSEIEISTTGTQRLGGDPGPEQREINEIIEWFEGQGAAVLFAARGGGSGSIENVQWTKHSAHILALDVDAHLYHAEGPSRLEAARRAKERWDADGRGALAAAVAEQDDGIRALHDVKSEEAARARRRHVFQVAWEEVTEPGNSNPVHKVEVFGEDGEVIEIGLGDDVEDGILTVALSLLPKPDDPRQRS